MSGAVIGVGVIWIKSMRIAIDQAKIIISQCFSFIVGRMDIVCMFQLSGQCVCLRQIIIVYAENYKYCCYVLCFKNQCTCIMNVS